MAEMEDESWLCVLCNLAFLADITRPTCMNELRAKLQRKSQYASELLCTAT